MPANQDITTLLAVWGAITGTIGTLSGAATLWLRLKQQKRDNRDIRCKSSFGFEAPPKASHRIRIESHGKRPVSIDHIRYYLIPRIRRHKLTKRLQHKRGRWLLKEKPKHPIRLTDGKNCDVPITLSSDFDVTDVYKVSVVDQTAKEWKVQWPTRHKLLRIATSEKLDFIKDEQEGRNASATGYRLGIRYFIEAEFNQHHTGAGRVNGRGFWYVDIGGYRNKWQEIKSQQIPAFLAGEIHEIK